MRAALLLSAQTKNLYGISTAIPARKGDRNRVGKTNHNQFPRLINLDKNADSIDCDRLKVESTLTTTEEIFKQYS